MKKATSPRMLDYSRLKHIGKKEAFSLLICKKDALSEISDNNVDDYCQKVSEAFKKTCKETLGYKEKTRKPWTSDNFWKLVSHRKVTKQKLLGCQDEELTGSVFLFKLIYPK